MQEYAKDFYVDLNNSTSNVLADIFRDFEIAKYSIAICIGSAIVGSLGFLLLLRWLAGPIIYGVTFICSFALVALTVYCWVKYREMKLDWDTRPPDERWSEDERNLKYIL